MGLKQIDGVSELRDTKEPEFLKEFKGSGLESELTQKTEIPLNLEGDEYTVYVTYRKETGKSNKTTLEINVPNIKTPLNGKIGLSAKFQAKPCLKKYAKSEFINFLEEVVETTGCVNPYGESSEKTTEFFKEKIEPVLRERLPNYMSKLINYNSSS